MSTLSSHPTRMVKSESWTRYLLPRQADILFVALFAAVMVLGSRLLNMDGDLGRHLTIGNYILEELRIPTSDIFSHTMYGVGLTPHEWLAQVVFALAYRMGGLDGVVLLCAVVIALSFTLVFRQCLDRSSLLVISLGMTILAAAAASLHWLARPHIFSILFTVLWVDQLERWRLDRKWYWWGMPLLMLIWVNTHGAFIIGILLWLIYLLGDFTSGQRSNHEVNEEQQVSDERAGHRIKTRQLLLSGFLGMAVTLVNPVSWRVWETTFGFLGNKYLVSHTVEYQAPDFQVMSFWPFLIMICLSVLLLSLSRKRLPAAHVLLLVIWTAFGLVSARNIPLYAVLAAPILAGVSATLILDSERLAGLSKFDQRLRQVDSQLVGYLWPAICILISCVVILTSGSSRPGGAQNSFSESVFPVKAVDWMEEKPAAGPVFNYFPWGGYLLYRSWPEELVFIDGQTDFYGEDLTRQYERVISLEEGWQQVLEGYQVRRVIMPPASKLVNQLKEMEGWAALYTDETAAILDFKP